MRYMGRKKENLKYNLDEVGLFCLGIFWKIIEQ